MSYRQRKPQSPKPPEPSQDKPHEETGLTSSDATELQNAEQALSVAGQHQQGSSPSPRWLFLSGVLDTGYAFAPLWTEGLFFIFPDSNCWVIRTRLMRLQEQVFESKEEALAYVRLQVYRYTHNRWKRAPTISRAFSWSWLPQDFRRRVLAEILNLMTKA